MINATYFLLLALFATIAYSTQQALNMLIEDDPVKLRTLHRRGLKALKFSYLITVIFIVAFIITLQHG